MTHRFLFPVLTLPLAVGLFGQYLPGTGGRQSRQQRTAPTKKNDTPSELLFKFEGVVKESSKKEFVVEVEGDQSLTFRRAKDIKVLDEKDAATDKSLPVGIKVAVEAKREMNGDLTARIVHVMTPPK